MTISTIRKGLSMNELDRLLQDSPTFSLYKHVNQLLIDIRHEAAGQNFYLLDYDRYWQIPTIPELQHDLRSVYVVFKRDMKGKYYFNISIEPFFSFGDYGYKTSYFSKNLSKTLNLLEASIVQEICENVKKTKQYLIELTKQSIDEGINPLVYIRKEKIKELFD